jgi:hypothetical protein
MRRFRLASAALALILAASVAQAQPVVVTETGKGPAWSSLSASQRQVLQPLASDWDSLPGDNRRKWVEVAGRFPTMSTEQQQRMQERMKSWADMSPAQRGEARLNFQQSKQVPSQDRQASWQAYQSLPTEQREALAAKAARPASAPTASAGPLKALRSASVEAQSPKSNIVVPVPATPAAKVVAPTVVQGNAGATTSLVSARPAPPAHQQVGQPKIAANPTLVDKSTLLPKKPVTPPSRANPLPSPSPSAATAAVPAATPTAPVAAPSTAPAQ